MKQYLVSNSLKKVTVALLPPSLPLLSPSLLVSGTNLDVVTPLSSCQHQGTAQDSTSVQWNPPNNNHPELRPDSVLVRHASYASALTARRRFGFQAVCT